VISSIPILRPEFHVTDLYVSSRKAPMFGSKQRGHTSWPIISMILKNT
jgi:hypothetical protein